MFYNLLFPLTDYVSWFNLFQYLTIRSGGALLSSFLVCLLFGPWMIRKFKAWQTGKDTVKDILPHQSKKGTPTMGGVMIFGAFLFSGLLWADLTNPYVWMVLGMGFAFGLIGLTDDLLSVTKIRKKGMPGRLRLLLEVLFACGFLLLFIKVAGVEKATAVHFPFFKEWIVGLGIFGFLAFGSMVMVGSANAVNLTDGLDGLVSIPAVIVVGSLAVLAYISGRADYTQYLNIPHMQGMGEVAVVCAALAGAILGFLWFNAPPARIFMGDTGSLAVGGVIGATAVLIKQEFTLLIIGGIFVIETLSVMIQIASFRLTGKRVFKMAPLHHHFEQLGWPETTIVIRFWIISLLLAIAGLATLKLR
ncbi:MAG: phospho-N-acetylmuramoyl-pentapeptide-transferase [Alphaproteobacteria bacterium]